MESRCSRLDTASRRSTRSGARPCSSPKASARTAISPTRYLAQRDLTGAAREAREALRIDARDEVSRDILARALKEKSKDQ